MSQSVITRTCFYVQNFWQSRSKLRIMKMLKFILFIVLVKKTQMFVIDCVCGNGSFHSVLIENVYSCYITNLNISTNDKVVTDVMRKHEIKMTNADVRLLKVHNQSCYEIPYKLGTFFIKIEGLEVIHSGLETLKKENLKDFKNLKYLNLMKNKIEILSNDTFQYTTKLQFIIICCNKLKIIGVDIFNDLNQRQHVDFRRNVCISRKSDNDDDLYSMKKEIAKKCPPKIEVYCTFADEDFPSGNYYMCEVRFWIVVIDYMAVEEFQGRHDGGRKNCNVRGLRVPEMTTKYLPINLCKHFPKLEAIEVVGGRMVRLEKKDIKIFPLLKVLWLPRNNIETLANDVFEGNLKLQKISFYENRLKFIGSEVFKPLKFLKYINMELNDCVDKFASTAVCIKSLEKEVAKECRVM